MKKLITIIFLITVLPQSVFAKLFANPYEWYIEGPGGEYGIYSCQSTSSLLLLGPITFHIPFSFETTRLVFFELLPILFFGLLVAAFISITAKTTIETPSKSFKVKLSYYVLIAFEILAIFLCIQLPKYLDWLEKVSEAKFCHAIQNNDIEFIKAYISEKNINEPICISYEIEGNDSNIVYPPPLPYAAELGNLKLVKFFLKHGADIENQDNSGTALHHACASPKSNLEIVKYLVEQGANINATNFWGETPLDKATSQEIKKYLMQNGAKTKEEMKKS